jgi:predicted exporter
MSPIAGLYMDTKRDLLLDAAIRDSRLALFAAFGVFLLLAIYSLSLAFAVAVLFQLSGAVLSSLSIFRLCASVEMPLLNMIAFVLLISVGSDRAFLLLDTFPRAEKLNQQSLAKAIEHTAKTMFLTQFSTVKQSRLKQIKSIIILLIYYQENKTTN